MPAKHNSRLLHSLCIIVLIRVAYGAQMHGGVFTVTYSNGTEGAIPFRVPASLRYAATPGTPGADINADSKCCLPLQAEVAGYDSTRYTLHSSTDCNAAYRVCSLPSRVQAVWVCGCPGGDCSGAHKISGKSRILGEGRVATAAAGMVDVPQVSSTAPLFAHQGLPTRITALTIRDKARKAQVYASSSGDPGSCDIQGFRVEYMQSSEVLGPQGVGKAAKTVLGSGLKNDPVVAVLSQQNKGCLTYIMTRTKSGRTAQVGSLNPALEMQSATAPEGAEGLAGLEVTLAPQQMGGLASLQLLWGSSKCSAQQHSQHTAAAIQAAPAEDASMTDEAVTPPTAEVVAAMLHIPGKTWTHDPQHPAVGAIRAKAYSHQEIKVPVSLTAFTAPAPAPAPTPAAAPAAAAAVEPHASQPAGPVKPQKPAWPHLWQGRFAAPAAAPAAAAVVGTATAPKPAPATAAVWAAIAAGVPAAAPKPAATPAPAAKPAPTPAATTASAPTPAPASTATDAAATTATRPASPAHLSAPPVAAATTAAPPTPAANAVTPGIPPTQASALALAPGTADATPPTFTAAAEQKDASAAEQAGPAVDTVPTPPASPTPSKATAQEVDLTRAKAVGTVLGTAAAAAIKAVQMARITDMKSVLSTDASHQQLPMPAVMARMTSAGPGSAPTVVARLTSVGTDSTTEAPAAAEVPAAAPEPAAHKTAAHTTQQQEPSNPPRCTGKAGAKKGPGVKGAMQKFGVAVGKVISQTAQAAEQQWMPQANTAQSPEKVATDAGHASVELPPTAQEPAVEVAAFEQPCPAEKHHAVQHAAKKPQTKAAVQQQVAAKEPKPQAAVQQQVAAKPTAAAEPKAVVQQHVAAKPQAVVASPQDGAAKPQGDAAKPETVAARAQNDASKPNAEGPEGTGSAASTTKPTAAKSPAAATVKLPPAAESPAASSSPAVAKSPAAAPKDATAVPHKDAAAGATTTPTAAKSPAASAAEPSGPSTATTGPAATSKAPAPAQQDAAAAGPTTPQPMAAGAADQVAAGAADKAAARAAEQAAAGAADKAAAPEKPAAGAAAAAEPPSGKGTAADTKTAMKPDTAAAPATAAAPETAAAEPPTGKGPAAADTKATKSDTAAAETKAAADSDTAAAQAQAQAAAKAQAQAKAAAAAARSNTHPDHPGPTLQDAAIDIEINMAPLMAFDVRPSEEKVKPQHDLDPSREPIRVMPSAHSAPSSSNIQQRPSAASSSSSNTSHNSNSSSQQQQSATISSHGPRVTVRRFYGPERKEAVLRAAAAMAAATEGEAVTSAADAGPVTASTSAVTAPKGAAQQTVAATAATHKTVEPAAVVAKASPKRFIGPARKPDVHVATAAAATSKPVGVVTTPAAQPPAATAAASKIGPVNRQGAVQVATVAAGPEPDSTVTTAAALPAAAAAAGSKMEAVNRKAAVQVATAAAGDKPGSTVTTAAALPAAAAAAASQNMKVKAVNRDQSTIKALTAPQYTMPSAVQVAEAKSVAAAQQLQKPGTQMIQAAGNANSAAVSVAATAAEPQAADHASTSTPAITKQKPSSNPSQSGYRVTAVSTERIADRLVPQLAALASASRLQPNWYRDVIKGRILMAAEAGKVLEQQKRSESWSHRNLLQQQKAVQEGTSGGGSTVPPAAASTRHLTAATTSSSSSSSNSGSGRLPPCRMSDPFCFTDSECYCRLANGTYGASCPMYGTCLGGCCSTTGECPGRMGYEDQATGQQQVLLAQTCSDWGLNEAGPFESLFTEAAAVAAAAAAGKAEKRPLLPKAKVGVDKTSGVECRLPKGRSCDPSKGGVACMGYTAAASQAKCEGSGCKGVQVQEGLLGAMCVYNKGDARRFDVCSCSPVY